MQNKPNGVELVQITTGYYLMKNGRKAWIHTVKDNGQGIGSYQRMRGKKLGWEYWVWEANGKAMFVEPSMRDLVEKLV